MRYMSRADLRLMPRYDWETIRHTYVSGSDEVTLAGLAERYGCARETVSRRAGKEGWGEQREQYRRRAAAKATERASTKEAEIRVRHMQIAQAMQGKAIARLRALNPDDLTPSELRHYLRDAAEIERKAAGIADEHTLDGRIQIVISELDAKL